MRHHFPKPDGDRVYFKRNQALGLGCVFILYLFMGGFLAATVNNPHDLGLADYRTVIALCAMPLVALFLPFITRGEDWAIDRRTRELLRRGHFLGISSRWKPYEKFDPQGTLSMAGEKNPNEPSGMTFHMVYQAPNGGPRTLLTTHQTTEEVQEGIKIIVAWEPRLTISTEKIDYTALQSLLIKRVKVK